MRFIISLMILLACFAGSAFGQATVPNPSEDLTGWAATTFKFFTSKEWGFALGAIIVLVVHLLRKLPNPFGWSWVEWLKTNKWGGWALNIGLSAASAISSALLARQPITLVLLLSALTGALASAGSLEFAKDTKILNKK